MKVLVTGGTGSLGMAIIEEFASGYDVTFTYHTQKERAVELANKFNCKYMHTSELDNAEFDFDIIINNAAISGEIDRAENISTESFAEVMLTNVVLPFNIIKKSLNHMKYNKFGRIINISSVYAIRVEEELTAFNTSKYALVGLSNSIAKEYAKFGITSNSILPGTFESEVSNKFADIYSNNEEEKENYYNNLIKDIPAKRLGNTKEIAKLIKFIASEEASYINGASITIDGAYSV